jgi:hypothetical protein
MMQHDVSRVAFLDKITEKEKAAVEQIIRTPGPSGVDNIYKVFHLLKDYTRNEDFETSIQWRRETLQNYYGLDDFKRRMESEDEPSYKENIYKLQKEIGDLERLQEFRQSIMVGMVQGEQQSVHPTND